MKKHFLLSFMLTVAACDSGVPNLKLNCARDGSEVLFTTDVNTNSIIGSDGTSTKFYQDNFVEIVFANFDESGSLIRVVNYYPADPGIEIIEDGGSTTWTCEHAN